MRATGRLCLVASHAACLAALYSPGMAAGQAPPRIPLCAGLTIVGAVSEPQGDYESILRVRTVDDQSVNVQYTSNRDVGTGVRHTKVSRTVLRKDLREASLLVNWFNPRAPVTIPGSTAFSTSAAILRSLKSTGSARLALIERGNSALSADPRVHPNIYDQPLTYTLQRADAGRAALTVTVNGELVALPVVHATGKYMGDKLDLHILDDEDNPLDLQTLLTPLGSTAPEAVAQTVKIAFQCDVAARHTPALADRLERALLETGRADVFDVYFDFNSERIREESEPTLQQIAVLLRRHPDWRLAIEGHTDSIGGDSANLDLSKRRADAVKSALVAAHGIVGARLATNGHGEARPRDRNDTLEGRARNRRVELVRLP